MKGLYKKLKTKWASRKEDFLFQDSKEDKASWDRVLVEEDPMGLYSGSDGRLLYIFLFIKFLEFIALASLTFSFIQGLQLFAFGYILGIFQQLKGYE